MKHAIHCSHSKSLILVFLLLASVDSLLRSTSQHRTIEHRLRAVIPARDVAAVETDARNANEFQQWWSSPDFPLMFDCSGCGKCCKTEGDVWLDSDELADLSEQLQLGHEETLEKYTELIASGSWVKLKNTKAADGNDACIFLNKEDGKTCSIYKSRPVQCRTYPYWPKLLFNTSTWEGNAVQPDNSAVGPYWEPSKGGCEGVNNVNATAPVAIETIFRNKALYDSYTDAFPYSDSSTLSAAAAAEDKERLLGKLGVIRAVNKATRAWVSDFVVKYQLCPFAENVFASDRVRYRVHFGNANTGEIIERVRYEMLALLTAKEEDVATTLLMLPFAFSDFIDWHAFTLELEDIIQPLLEKELKGPLPTSQLEKSPAQLPSRPRLAQKLVANRQQQQQQGCPALGNGNVDDRGNLPAIQFAFFHPSFVWAGSSENAQLNFEKRAPFPTINLLRAARIRAWANEDATKTIADNNENKLSSADPAKLTEEFERIIRVALS